MQCVGGAVAEGGVVEDDPGWWGGFVLEGGGEVGEELLGVLGVVGAGGAVEAEVVEALPASGFGGECGAFGWVGGYAGNFEVAEQAVDGGREPACVAGFEDGVAGLRWVVADGVKLAEGGEELVGDAFVEGELGWKLDEKWAELCVEAADLIDEGLKERAGVDELCCVRDGLGEFDGEAEVVGCCSGPTLPGFEHVRAVEAGVDFDAVEDAGVAVEV